MWQGSYTYVVNQWGVGHGGFHSQSLLFQAQDRNPTVALGAGSMVRVIYDCGAGRTTQPHLALARAVGRMLDDVADESVISLLVVSHFDRDHINGLDHLSAELIKKQIRVDRVWAPVLTKIEALLAIVSSGLAGAEQQDYAAFMNDPAGRLSSLFDDAEVTLITSDDAPIPLSSGQASSSDADADADAGAGAGAGGGSGDVILTSGPGGRGLFASPDAATASEFLWEFQPYVIASTLVGAHAVSAAVQKILGKPVEQCTLADLIRLANDATVLTTFHTAVRQHHSLSNVGARASSARSGPNLSSLCVYSGPVSPYDWCRYRRGWDSVDPTRRAIPIAPGWLGTGDAGLLGTQHVDAMRTALTQSRLDRVGISSAPHHGSRHDSDAPLWDALPNARWVTIEANYSCGWGAGNNHPHTQVTAELATRNLNVHRSVDGNDFSWSQKGIR